METVPPKKTWSTNPLERLNKEIKCRTDVVGVIPHPAALLRLAGAVLVDARRMAGLRPPLPLLRLHDPAQPARDSDQGGGAAGPDRVIVQTAEDPANQTELHHRAGRHLEGQVWA
jgi:hypothetical protein